MAVITAVNGDVQFFENGIGAPALAAAGNPLPVGPVAPFAGNQGLLIAVPPGPSLREVTKWSWSAKINSVEYASNFTGGVKRKLVGSKGASGTVNGVYDTKFPIHGQVREGSTGIMLFFFTSAHFIRCPVIVEKLDFGTDIDGSAIEDWTVDWSANGLWSYPFALAALVARGANGPIMPDMARGFARDLGIEDEEDIASIGSVARMVAAHLRDNPYEAVMDNGEYLKI